MFQWIIHKSLFCNDKPRVNALEKKMFKFRAPVVIYDSDIVNVPCSRTRVIRDVSRNNSPGPFGRKLLALENKTENKMGPVQRTTPLYMYIVCRRTMPQSPCCRQRRLLWSVFFSSLCIFNYYRRCLLAANSSEANPNIERPLEP